MQCMEQAKPEAFEFWSGASDARLSCFGSPDAEDVSPFDFERILKLQASCQDNGPRDLQDVFNMIDAGRLHGPN